MFADILIHCADIAALELEIGIDDPEAESHDFYQIPSTPRKVTGAAFVALLRATPEQEAILLNIAAIEAIGTDTGGPFYNFNTGGAALYDAVYSQAVVQVDDGQGGTVPYTPPAKIGVFF